MNKIETIEKLASLFRRDCYSSASLLLVADGKIIFGRPVFNDSEFPDNPPCSSAPEIIEFLKSRQLRPDEPTPLCSGGDGILLRDVSVKNYPENFDVDLLYVFYDSITGITIIP